MFQVFSKVWDSITTYYDLLLLTLTKKTLSTYCAWKQTYTQTFIASRSCLLPSVNRELPATGRLEDSGQQNDEIFWHLFSFYWESCYPSGSACILRKSLLSTFCRCLIYVAVRQWPTSLKSIINFVTLLRKCYPDLA